MRKLNAMICGALLAVTLFGCAHPQAPEATQSPTYGERQWTPIYNDHTCGINISWNDSERASEKELTPAQLQAVLPGKWPAGATYTGAGHFRKDGSVLRLCIWVKKGEADAFIAMGANADIFACCISREPDAKVSQCGDLEYRIYRKDSILFAETVCNGYPVLISVRAKTNPVDVDGQGAVAYVRENIEQHRPLFEEILECISWYDSKEPNLDIVLENGLQ